VFACDIVGVEKKNRFIILTAISAAMIIFSAYTESSIRSFLSSTNKILHTTKTIQLRRRRIIFKSSTRYFARISECPFEYCNNDPLELWSLYNTTRVVPAEAVAAVTPNKNHYYRLATILLYCSVLSFVYRYYYYYID